MPSAMVGDTTATGGRRAPCSGEVRRPGADQRTAPGARGWSLAGRLAPSAPAKSPSSGSTPPGRRRGRPGGLPGHGEGRRRTPPGSVGWLEADGTGSGRGERAQEPARTRPPEADERSAQRGSLVPGDRPGNWLRGPGHGARRKGRLWRPRRRAQRKVGSPGHQRRKARRTAGLTGRGGGSASSVRGWARWLGRAGGADCSGVWVGEWLVHSVTGWNV